MGLVDDIKTQAKRAGTNKGKFIYFKPGTKVRIRFLQDAEEGQKVTFHDSFADNVNVPCQEFFGRECNYCNRDGLRTRELYAWSVWDYDAKEVKVLLGAVNNASPIPMLVGMYEAYGTMMDRDYVITKNGQGTSSSFAVVPMDKVKFRNDAAKPFSKAAFAKLLDKAFPDDETPAEDDDDEPKAKKQKTGKPPKATEKDDEEWEEETSDDAVDYTELTPKELYDLCKEREIEKVEVRKPAAYYIKKLEAFDRENAEGGDDEW